MTHGLMKAKSICVVPFNRPILLLCKQNVQPERFYFLLTVFFCVKYILIWFINARVHCYFRFTNLYVFYQPVYFLFLKMPWNYLLYLFMITTSDSKCLIREFLNVNCKRCEEIRKFSDRPYPNHIYATHIYFWHYDICNVEV